ncbi:MAG TPA: VIT and VWA domain-containing protein [Fimbriimonadaceae bacterium]|nr:VIT and VWA domain-containing protein [Fimbriimonadaceae bacterium]
MLLSTLAALCLQSQGEMAPPGQLTAIDRAGTPGVLCPLKNTSVRAEITGFGARVVVVQTFVNPSKTPIEAIYTFPLPAEAAVDRMRMRIGTRIVEGEIKRREEARAIYEAAKAQGQVASLLDQERPNIFTQSVANVMPGAKIEVEISYVELLKFEEGEFEFKYPMVVGPRYIGATVPDPSKVDPPTVAKGTRSGTTIDIEVAIDAGAPITGLRSVLHEVAVARKGEQAARVTLKRKDEIPNKDFILRYTPAADTVQSAFLTTVDPKKGGAFTLVLLPPRVEKPALVAPKEMIFIMDQSGSQGGFPIEKSKELTKKLLGRLNPSDTFNVLGFSTQVNPLWPEPRPVSEANLAEAMRFVDGIQAGGGTNLLEPVKAALSNPADPGRIRVVLFNTDGYVGNDFEVLKAVQQYRANSRMFTFGIGNAVNTFLIDAMSAEGRGDSELVTLAESADKATERFIRRTQSPVLTDIQADFQGVQVDDVLPSVIPDVFSAKPVIIQGRYTKPGKGSIVVRGKLGGEEWSRQIEIELPARGNSGSAIQTLWARAKVADLMRVDWMAQFGEQGSRDRNKVTDQITQIGLNYGIMTQFTSFVAVEKKIVNVGGKQRTVPVPIDRADGVGDPAFKDAAGAPVAGRTMGGGGGGFGGGTAGLAPSSAAPGKPALGRGAPQEKLKEGGRDEADKKSAADPEVVRSANFRNKVAAKLRSVKGKVEVQLAVKDVTAALLAKLKKLGLKVDDSDKGLRVVFGTVDAKVLIELAQLDEVRRIDPI